MSFVLWADPKQTHMLCAFSKLIFNSQWQFQDQLDIFKDFCDLITERKWQWNGKPKCNLKNLCFNIAFRIFLLHGTTWSPTNTVSFVTLRRAESCFYLYNNNVRLILMRVNFEKQVCLGQGSVTVPSSMQLSQVLRLCHSTRFPGPKQNVMGSSLYGFICFKKLKRPVLDVGQLSVLKYAFCN